MSNKSPAWFIDWAKTLDNEITGIKKDILDIKHDIIVIKNCHTI